MSNSKIVIMTARLYVQRVGDWSEYTWEVKVKKTVRGEFEVYTGPAQFKVSEALDQMNKFIARLP